MREVLEVRTFRRQCRRFWKKKLACIEGSHGKCDLSRDDRAQNEFSTINGSRDIKFPETAQNLLVQSFFEFCEKLNREMLSQIRYK